MRYKNIILLVFLLFLFNISIAFAQTPTINPSPTSIQPSPVKYTLSYPGMIPDNPLYKIKVLRDKITIKLMSDPQKKIDFYLLQTDKQIAMVPLLVDKKMVDLAKTTALKAENNFTELTFVYKAYGFVPDEKMLRKLKSAAAKHQQVLNDAMTKVDSNDKQTFQQVINFSKTNVDELDKIVKKAQRKAKKTIKQ
ncbi:MAG: DUF5667 domain-containing protein [Candidatus Levybacteria bacterium]|nr:DUF5667 domain-containing protein [Candidatus Levybacteria bacterium]